MCDRIGEIRSRGADLVMVGNGAPHFAVAFREDFNLDGPPPSTERASTFTRSRFVTTTRKTAGHCGGSVKIMFAAGLTRNGSETYQLTFQLSGKAATKQAGAGVPGGPKVG